MTEATIYNWLKQDRIDRGEEAGRTTDQQLELAAARRRIKQLETELAVSRKINEVFLKEGVSPKGFKPSVWPARAKSEHTRTLLRELDASRTRLEHR
jgi:hypothetical protein